MPQISGYVAIALVAVEVLLIFALVAGKVTKTAFGLASPVILFTAVFFWMADRVTEMTIAGVGTIKTAATLATQYVDEIKRIKDDVERQRQDIAAAVSALKSQIQEETAEIEKLKPRHITTEQKEEIISLLKPAHKPNEPIYFNNAVSASGEAIQFSQEIKSVLMASGFKTEDVPFGDSTFFGFSGLGTFLEFKDKEHPPEAAKIISRAFRQVGIPLFGFPSPELGDPERVVVIVGTHP